MASRTVTDPPMPPYVAFCGAGGAVVGGDVGVPAVDVGVVPEVAVVLDVAVVGVPAAPSVVGVLPAASSVVAVLPSVELVPVVSVVATDDESSLPSTGESNDPAGCKLGAAGSVRFSARAPPANSTTHAAVPATITLRRRTWRTRRVTCP